MTLYMRDQEKIEEGIEIGREAERTKMIQKLIQAGFTMSDPAVIALGVSESEFKEAEKLLLTTTV